MRFRPKRGLTIFVAVFLPLVLSLAAWQDRRATEKAVLEARLATQGTQPAQRLEVWLTQPADAWAYAPAFTQGRWQAQRALGSITKRPGGEQAMASMCRWPWAMAPGFWWTWAFALPQREGVSCRP